MTLYPDLEFVAKTQALDAVAEPIKLRAFTSVGSADIDRKLCPGRSLLQYRKATTSPECRKGRKKLFISYKPSKSDEIKRATISSWIVKLIRLAYESEGSDPRTREAPQISARVAKPILPTVNPEIVTTSAWFFLLICIHTGYWKLLRLVGFEKTLGNFFY